MSNTLGDNLRKAFGFSPGDEVDAAEMAVIELTIKKILGMMFGVADTHDTDDTKSILSGVQAVVKSMSGMSPVEVQSLLGLMANTKLGGGFTPPAPSALGVGSGSTMSPPVVTSRDAINIIMADSSVPDGHKHAIRRLLSTGGDKIDVLSDGTPSATFAVEQKCKDLQKQLDAANKTKSTGTTPTAPIVGGGVDTAKIKAEITKIETAANTARPSNLGKKEMIVPNPGHQTILDAVTALKKLVP